MRALQKYLNAHGFILANSGPGAPGSETTVFGYATQYQLQKFQAANSVTPPAGYFGPLTRGSVIGGSAQTTTRAQTASSTTAYQFTRNLSLHDSGEDVHAVQEYLNAQGFALAESGPGSPGNETEKFGTLTYTALVQFQNGRAGDILIPLGITEGTGYFGASTRALSTAIQTSRRA